MRAHLQGLNFLLFVALWSAALGWTLTSGENLNGIYLGENVSSSNPADIAIRITEDGTVTAYRGAVVPGMHDRHGKPVRVRKVVIQ